ncbi:uncharacterized protein LOC108664884 [Hyalella azteca]|uniref:Uncharacterized protein LOC108664884 n=1 Tax=Hyalella azteca TaxID=294128 RepID=A0A8B7N0K5_HYAAZ|nr:uncharacterized protein LOC108664884 [Hyalella azteca]
MLTDKNQELESEAVLTEECRRHSSASIEDPTKEVEFRYIVEERDDLARKYTYEKSKGGKWVLFFKTEDLFSMWKKACLLYRSGTLQGVTSVVSSTAKANPSRTSRHELKVISFQCGPYDDRDLMLRYGMNIVELLRYTNITGHI